MLTGEQYASFHIMKSDELWHFYAGSSLTLYIIERNDRRLSKLILGADIDKGESLQIVVKSCSWFAASVNDTSSYSLVGCTVSPGFDYRDWKLGDIKPLVTLYPQHHSIIERF
jgi:predicted cupin superfamily sugar epimerase